jgi:ubiquinone/menaquinone biosynthesis C-methylase UbiE
MPIGVAGEERVMSESGIDPQAFNAFEAAGWQDRAAGYDAFFAPITSRLAGPLLDAVGASDGVRLLDIATGPGYVAAAAARRGARVTGVDIAEAMIESASRAHPEVDFRQADAEALPFPDSSFDAVVSNFGILHFGRPDQAVAESCRVLAPGGRLAMTVWDSPDRARLIGVFVEAMAIAGAAAPEDIPVGPPFFQFSSQEAFAGLATGAGLTEVNVRRVAFTHRIRSADTLWDGLLGGTVRTSAAVLRQPAPMRAQIRAGFDRLVGAHAAEGGELDLPVSVKLMSGRKPGSS